MTAPHDDLKKLAKKATPGPWKTAEFAKLPKSIVAAGRTNLLGVLDDEEGEWAQFASKSDADYVAAANPARILALIDENKTLLGEAVRLVAENGRLRQRDTDAVAQLSVDGSDHERLAKQNAALLARVERLEAAVKAHLNSRAPFDASDAVGQFYGEIEQSAYEEFYETRRLLSAALASPEQEPKP